ncbi:ORF V: Enzymatic polyprotein [Labeo rohita]|uniref:ORF V: Enzymatic polyprotein n=1 Tax=Labeo rohita TaxID=84645 RepID=A0ABQ8L6E4_LABRO|nr:ORF V: Enzymatic polyprotein [Labeo rohita]
MAAAAAVTLLGLLHMRPLQHWLHDRVLRWAWHRGTLRIGVSLQCRRLFSPWSDPAFLQAGVPLGQVSRHLVVYTDASSTGWGAVCNGQAVSGSWTGPRLQWHINCLELLAVLLALHRFRPMLRHNHVLVRTDSTATVAYINHQGELNHAADQLSRQSTHPGEWRLHPQRGSPRQGCTGTQLASGAQVCLSPSEPPCTDTVQDQGGRGAGSAGCAILAHPDLVSRPHFPCGSPSLEDPLEERPSFSGDGHNLAPASRPMEPARLAPGRDASDLSGLSQAVIDTITQSRAPSKRQAYALRWGLFIDWCSFRGEDPQICPIAKLERRLSPSTLKVYVAAIAAYHDAVEGASLGKHQLIVRFLRGARRVNPPRPHLVPSWDLSVTLQGLREAPFEPLASVELKHVSLKTALLTALASIKRVGELQAFSVNKACLEFGPGDSHVMLRPRPGYVPKVPTTPFCDQVVNLQALPLEEADPASALLCPVHTSDAPSSSLSALEVSRKGMLSPNRGWPIGW